MPTRSTIEFSWRSSAKLSGTVILTVITNLPRQWTGTPRHQALRPCRRGEWDCARRISGEDRDSAEIKNLFLIERCASTSRQLRRKLSLPAQHIDQDPRPLPIGKNGVSARDGQNQRVLGERRQRVQTRGRYRRWGYFGRKDPPHLRGLINHGMR